MLRAKVNTPTRPKLRDEEEGGEGGGGGGGRGVILILLSSQSTVQGNITLIVMTWSMSG